jgi:hypothetical protein
MNRRLFIALLFFPYLILTQISAQDSFFEKLYHNTEILYTVQQTTDDGFIISGLRPLNAGNHVLLMKVDSNGDTIWTQDYAGMGEADYYRTAAIQATDGGYVLTGTTQDTEKSDVFVVKTDTRGETVWQKTYEDSLEEKSWSIQNTLDGGYLIDAKRELNKIHLIKIDSIGQVDWESELGPILSFDLRKQVIQTTDSGYVIVSRSEMYKLSQNGESLWAKSFDVRFYLIQELTDRSLIVAGRDILFKTNSDGEEIWRQELEFNPNDLLITENEDIILAGDKLIRFDSEGMELWMLELDGTAYSCIHAEDGIVFCGKLPEIPEGRRGWMVKTESDGYYKSLILLQPQELPDSRWSGKIRILIPYEITWRSYNVQEIDIDYSPNNGYEWTSLEEQYPADENSYLWIPEGFPTSEGLIKISEVADPDFTDQTQDPFCVVRSYDYIAINDIKMYFSNYGAGSHNPQNDGPGLYWPEGENGTKTAVFQDGLLWSGKVDGEVRASGNTYRSSQQPGIIFPDGTAGNPDSLLYSIWKIRYDWGVYPPGWERDRLEYDYNHWPVEIGAPWIDNNQDGIYDPNVDQPKIYGDETNWFVMNDMDTARSHFLYGTDPIGLEIQCTIYGYNRQDALGDVVFKKYRMINKGQNIVEDMYFEYWSDPDLGDANDDFVGCDTLLNLAYCYNADNSDGDGIWRGKYGLSSPAVGYILIQGPIVPFFPVDSAYFNDRWINGYKNLDMTSFYIYINGDIAFSDPDSGVPKGAEQLYNNLQGLHWNGDPIIDPHSGNSTNFPLAGDPVSGTGWYEGTGWPEGPEAHDRRMLLGTGPFNFSPGDTQEIVIAIVLAQGEDHLDSVTKLKEKAAAVRQFYYTGDLTGIGDRASSQPGAFRLEQNYPNPFNPKTFINYQLPITNKVDLSIYNLLGQKVVTLVSKKQKAGPHQVEWDASRFASGVYFYILRAGDYRDVKKMVLLK